MKRPLNLWTRFRISTRIAAAIILALISVQAFAIAQFLLTPAPQWKVYGLRWLAKTVSDAALLAFDTPTSQRATRMRIAGGEWLTVNWQPQSPAFFSERSEPHPLAERIAATLRARLQASIKDVRVTLAGPGPAGPPRGSITFIPTGLEASLRAGALRDDEPDIAIPGLFRISIQGHDESWIILSPRDSDARPWRYWPMLPLLGGTLVVVLLSLFTARRILAPLNQLTDAARRLGTERTPSPIDAHGLGEFASIAEAFNDMQARLKRFVDERTQMLAAMSHDLRTSLTRLRLEVENVTDAGPRRDLTREIDEMEAMISATLAFASSDAKGEPSRIIDLAALLISLCDEVSDRGSNAVYKGPNHARLCCQPVTMKRALANIIDNAVKYGRMVNVALDMTARAAVVLISDEGPGIPADRRQEAFAPFRRLETSRNRNTGGVGLGLTIARDVVHAHGGTIDLGDGDPHGLVVTMVLPLQDSSGQSA